MFHIALSGLCEQMVTRSRSVMSMNGNWRFKCIPDSRLRLGRCVGVLEQRNGHLVWREAWRRYLINDIAPDAYKVSDKGVVITINERNQRPSAVPLVIYRQDGSVMMTHSRQSLGFYDGEPPLGVNSVADWTSGALISFFDFEWSGTLVECLLLRLRWNKLVVLSLENGTNLSYLFGSPEDRTTLRPLIARAQERILEEVPRLIKSSDPYMRETGAVIAGQDRMQDVVPLLEDLLQDDGYFSILYSETGEVKRVFFVRDAARVALEQIRAGPGKEH